MHPAQSARYQATTRESDWKLTTEPVADPADHDLARVEADARREREPARALQLLGLAAQRIAQVPSDLQQLNKRSVHRAMEIIRNRIDQFGVSEPLIQKSGDSRIVVELAGISDPARAMAIVHIAVFGGDIEITQYHEIRIRRGFQGQPGMHFLQPLQFVGKLFGANFTAIDHVQVDDANFAQRGRDRHREDAALRVVKPGNIRHHLAGGFPAQHGNAVVSRLTGKNAVVTHPLQFPG